MGVKEGGAFLRAQREKLGLKQVGVSLAAGMNQDGTLKVPFELVTRLERGVFASVKFEDICRIGEVLHLDPTTLARAYGYWPDKGEVQDTLQAAMDTASTLSTEHQDYIAQVIYKTVEAAKEDTPV